MGEYIKVKGLSIPLTSNTEYAYEIYEKLNLMHYVEVDEDGYICEQFNNTETWTPYKDENGTYGLIYTIQYEWGGEVQEMLHEDDFPKIEPPLVDLPKPKIFFLYYYTATEYPFEFI